MKNKNILQNNLAELSSEENNKKMTTLIDIDMGKDFVYCQYEKNVLITDSTLIDIFLYSDREEEAREIAKDMEINTFQGVSEAFLKMGFEIRRNDIKRNWSEY